MLTISPASVIASKVFVLVAEHLNERQRRLLLGAFALVAGRGAPAAGLAVEVGQPIVLLRNQHKSNALRVWA